MKYVLSSLFFFLLRKYWNNSLQEYIRRRFLKEARWDTYALISSRAIKQQKLREKVNYTCCKSSVARQSLLLVMTNYRGRLTGWNDYQLECGNSDCVIPASKTFHYPFKLNELFATMILMRRDYLDVMTSSGTHERFKYLSYTIPHAKRLYTIQNLENKSLKEEK